MLIKPFTQVVDASGHAVITISHSLSGIQWKVFQTGIALGKFAANASVAAHVNGIPLAATITMQPSVFASIPTQSPYAMESFMVGPPYIILQSGDQMVIAVQNATPGDFLTVGAYIEEHDYREQLTMGT